MLRLIHFSDIHLRSPDCDFDHSDENIHIRDRVQRDIVKLIQTDGKAVDAILVTGDIAFAGKESEYKAAHKWLNDLKETLSLTNDQIFVVPGNHDVDRDEADKFLPKTVRGGVESKTSFWQRDNSIVEALKSDHADEAIFAPMQKYIDFSSSYGCEISPSLPFWSKTLKLSESIDVELRGITTPLFSNKSDKKGSLVLSKNQFNFRSRSGVLYLSLMHHPCDWLVDSDEIEDLLDNNVHIQLFGHKHRARWSNADNLLKIDSISLHPEKHESGYEPGYNIIELHQTQSNDKECTVTVKVVVRKLEFSPSTFVSKKFQGEREYFTKDITLPISESKTPCTNQEVPAPEAGEKKQSNYIADQNPGSACEPVEQKIVNIKEASRVFALFDRSKKDSILIECSLLEQNELAESDIKKQQVAFQRAIEQGKETLLYDMIMMKGKTL
ncbi:metallophosphoesterase [Vibrio harveyi]|nr:metallophosphoesterase [Vibrio harveyi]